MRTAPAVRVTVARFAVWRAMVSVWAVLALLSLAAWALTRAQGSNVVTLTAAAVGTLLVAGVAVSLLCVEPVHLQWDGQCWLCNTTSAPTHEPVRGDVVVSIDLGGWMLLRFNPEIRRRPRWIPLQRQGLERHWHALRCAVYSPRPEMGDPLDDSYRASTRTDSLA